MPNLTKVWLVQTDTKTEIWSRPPTSAECLARVKASMAEGRSLPQVIFTWNAVGTDVFYPDGAPEDEDALTVSCHCGQVFQVEKHWLGNCPQCHSEYSTVDS